jgi:hypothetical protein
MGVSQTWLGPLFTVPFDKIYPLPSVNQYEITHKEPDETIRNGQCREAI